MKFKELLQKVKDFIATKKEQFNSLNKEKRIAIIIGVVAVISALAFGAMYTINNKYQVLFSGLDSNDAAAITKELENRKITTKIEGDGIYVPKEEVDKLRLELSGSISNGSKGFEIMDEGSSFGMTDEEFQIKKQRMTQGEIEKTIKTFPQVENARVHITNGTESVFATESTPGTAAVYLDLKPGMGLEPAQVKSIISLISASTSNIPKQNVEVVDQNMNLLSEGLFDENGNANAASSNGLDLARKAEKQLNTDLERSVITILEPIFGQGKVKVSVNSDLNFDNSEKTETIIDPNRVAVKESKTENKSTDKTNAGGAVDNNMNNVGNANDATSESKEESYEYEVGKTETKVVKAQGEINKITASVAIDGVLDPVAVANVEKMVSNAIGMDPARGDNVAIVGMDFANNANGATGFGAMMEDPEVARIVKTVAYIVAALVLLIIGILVSMFITKKKNEKEEEFDDDYEIELINQKLEEMEMDRLNGLEEDEENISLEEEVRKYASDNPDQVTELINSWLNE